MFISLALHVLENVIENNDQRYSCFIDKIFKVFLAEKRAWHAITYVPGARFLPESSVSANMRIRWAVSDRNFWPIFVLGARFWTYIYVSGFLSWCDDCPDMSATGLTLSLVLFLTPLGGPKSISNQSLNNLYLIGMKVELA